MRVLVTGGSGFLGSHVAELLHGQGHEVSCLVRKSSDTTFLRSLGVKLVEGAVDDASTLPAAVEGAEAIVHCAGLVKARTMADFDRVHTGGTLGLARAAIAAKAPLKRFVHVSTSGVMGLGAPGRKHQVDDEPAPQTSYDKSKLAAERALLELAGELPITVLRPPAIYGPRDREILAFFQMVRRTRVAWRMGRSMQAVSMIYASDCASACERAIFADVPSGSIYFVDDGQVYDYETMARAIADAYGIKLLATPSLPAPIVTVAAAASETFGKLTNKVMMFTRDKLPMLLAEHFVIDSSPARRDLGWEPAVPFAEGARRTAAWYRENRWD